MKINLPDPKIIQQSKVFNQKGFKKALKEAEYPDFDVDDIFDKNFKAGKEVAMGKPEKKKKNTDCKMKKCDMIKTSRRNMKY
jgi:hypothetical protein